MPEDLYTVYSDGTNSDIPVSNPATLNFASEDGFLCKPNTATGADHRNPDHRPGDRAHLPVGDRGGHHGRKASSRSTVSTRTCRSRRATPTTPADAISSFTSSLVLPVRHPAGLWRAGRGVLQRRDHGRQHRPSVICLHRLMCGPGRPVRPDCPGPTKARAASFGKRPSPDRLGAANLY